MWKAESVQFSVLESEDGVMEQYILFILQNQFCNILWNEHVLNLHSNSGICVCVFIPIYIAVIY